MGDSLDGAAAELWLRKIDDGVEDERIKGPNCIVILVPVGMSPTWPDFFCMWTVT